MQEYLYQGAVMEFDRCIDPYWEATTYAASPAKARSNLAYRYKKMHGKAANTKITLPGKLVIFERSEA